MARTLYDKLWDSHVVREEKDGTALIYIDRHLVHEVTSPQAYEGLEAAGRKPWRVDSVVATADHNTPTKDWDKGIRDPVSRLQVETLDENIEKFGAKVYFPFLDKRQGIVHVIGPEQGATLPGMTVVCGDSHTSTHGAFGALAFGIGTSEVEHVLATQCMVMKKSKTMQVLVEGKLGPGVTAKDITLAVIGKIGSGGGTGYAIEYAGEAIRALSMEGRMTLCNMAIEAGARTGLVAVDEKTIDYLEGRPFAPKGELWDEAVAYWRTLKSDDGAQFDKVVTLEAEEIKPQVTWGTNPQMVVAGRRQGARSRAGEGSGAARMDRARAQVHGARTEHADHGHQARQDLHRLVHQLAHRRPARGGAGREGQARRVEHQARDGRAGLGARERRRPSRKVSTRSSPKPASNGASRAARCASA